MDLTAKRVTEHRAALVGDEVYRVVHLMLFPGVDCCEGISLLCRTRILPARNLSGSSGAGRWSVTSDRSRRGGLSRSGRKGLKSTYSDFDWSMR